MIHRAMLGSLERFFGVLPRAYCRQIPYLARPRSGRHLADHRWTQRLGRRGRGRRCRSRPRTCGSRWTDARSEKLGLKIREATLDCKVPLHARLGGQRGRRARGVAPRSRDGKTGPLESPSEAFVARHGRAEAALPSRGPLATCRLRLKPRRLAKKQARPQRSARAGLTNDLGASQRAEPA